MLDLLSDPAVWASFATLTLLEIVLGVDNVIFISIASGKLPEAQRRPARLIGLTGALVLRVGLLFSISWIVSLQEPVFALVGHGFSWRDVILFAGGVFLLWKATVEIFAEVEGEDEDETSPEQELMAGFAGVIAQIMVLDLVFSLDSVITAVGIAEELAVMIAAVVVAILVMMAAAEPVSQFVEAHPSTKMLALSFLVMVGAALVADGFGVHFERGFIYTAMAFSAGVEALNLWRSKRRRKA